MGTLTLISRANIAAQFFKKGAPRAGRVQQKFFNTASVARAANYDSYLARYGRSPVAEVNRLLGDNK